MGQCHFLTLFDQQFLVKHRIVQVQTYQTLLKLAWVTTFYNSKEQSIRNKNKESRSLFFITVSDACCPSLLEKVMTREF